MQCAVHVTCPNTHINKAWPVQSNGACRCAVYAHYFVAMDLFCHRPASATCITHQHQSLLHSNWFYTVIWLMLSLHQKLSDFYCQEEECTGIYSDEVSQRSTSFLLFFCVCLLWWQQKCQDMSSPVVITTWILISTVLPSRNLFITVTLTRQDSSIMPPLLNPNNICSIY